MAKNVKKILGYLFIFFLIILFFVSLYIRLTFDNIPFSQIIYSFRNSQGTSASVVRDGVIYVVPKAIILFIFLTFLQKQIDKHIINSDKKLFLDIKIFNKKIKKQLFKYTNVKRIVLYIISCLALVIFIFFNLRIWEFIYSSMQYTKIYEEEYVNPRDVNISFKEKRNLIYLIVESEEMTNASIKNGGGVERSYIPNLEELALNNTNFSNTDSLGGALNVSGAGYTAGSLVAQTSGTPVIGFLGNEYHGYSDSFPGLYTLGEVLEKNGYKNYFIMGSDADFGGRSDYFKNHGNYKLLDYVYAKDNKWIPKDYNVWWGYEDKKLFEFAKKELTNISKNEEPFNFTILTADTHFIDGYYDETCSDPGFDSVYANVFHCNDNMINDFISWVVKQDFYKNTTIVIIGDHLTMQGGFYKSLSDGYTRTIYNTIMNSAVKEDVNNKNRQFTVLDMYPTTLVAIGAEVEGDTLGFGVNLYSGKQTLVEKLGYDYVNAELDKNSMYYNDYILGSTYYEINKKG